MLHSCLTAASWPHAAAVTGCETKAAGSILPIDLSMSRGYMMRPSPAKTTGMGLLVRSQYSREWPTRKAGSAESRILWLRPPMTITAQQSRIVSMDALKA